MGASVAVAGNSRRRATGRTAAPHSLLPVALNFATVPRPACWVITTMPLAERKLGKENGGILILTVVSHVMRRWTSWTAFAAAGVLIALMGLSPLAGGEPPRAAKNEPSTPALPARVFAESSFWYTPIPADAPLHPNSASFVTEFLRQKKAYYGTVSINTTAYASPVYIADAAAPNVQVTEWDCQHKKFSDPELAKQWKAVPVPAHAEAATGTDAEMTIYQPSTDTMWEFWQARKVNGGWQGCWGGRMQNVSKGQGIWQKPYGTTATGLPFLGGQITPEELRQGEIKHAMGISLVNTEKWSIYSWPANRSDGYNPKNAPNRIPEGLRFRLDPAVDVQSLKMHPMGKVIAKAAQMYGFVVWDKAGAITLRAQNPKSYTTLGLPDPYPALFKATPTYALLNGFPWEKLRFLPHDFGKPR